MKHEINWDEIYSGNPILRPWRDWEFLVVKFECCKIEYLMLFNWSKQLHNKATKASIGVQSIVTVIIQEFLQMANRHTYRKANSATEKQKERHKDRLIGRQINVAL